jgi:hypothetical protein
MRFLLFRPYWWHTGDAFDDHDYITAAIHPTKHDSRSRSVLLTLCLVSQMINHELNSVFLACGGGQQSVQLKIKALFNTLGLGLPSGLFYRNSFKSPLLETLFTGALF